MFRNRWFRVWNRLSQPARSTGRAAAKPRPRTLLHVEEFEPRVTPSCNISVVSQVLTVTCDSSVNTVNVTDNGANTNVNGVILADPTFNSMQVNIGTGGGTVNLFQTTRAGNISEVGPGNVTVNVSPTLQNLNFIAGVTITRGSGTDTLVINDQLDPAAGETYAMTATSISRFNPINFGTPMNFVTLNGSNGMDTYNVTGTGGVNSTTIRTGGGKNTINVENTNTGRPLLVNETGTGNDTVNVSPTAHNLNNIQGGVNITGNFGTDTLNVSDQSNGTGVTYDLAATFLSRTFSAGISFGTLMNFVNINGGSAANVYFVTGTGGINLTTLQTGGGNDTINVDNTNATHALAIIEQFSGNDTVAMSPAARNLNTIQGAVSITGNAGNDTLDVNDQNDTVGVIYTVTATSIADNNPASATTSFGGMNTVRLFGSSGEDIYNVSGTGGRVSNVVQTSIVNNGNTDFVNVLATTHPLTISLGRFASSVDISSTAHNLNTIQGAVNVVGRVGTLNVDDQGNTNSGLTYTLTGNSVTRTGAALVSFSGGSPVLEVNAATENNGNVYNVTGTQAGFTFLNLHHTQSANDTVNVQATTGPLNINGGLGDRVNVGDSTGVQDIRGSLDCGLVTFVTVNDGPDTTPRTVIMTVDALGNASITGLAPAVITYGQNNIARVTVNGGSSSSVVNGGNTFNVQATVTNGLLPVTIVNSGSGNDTINVGDTSNTLNEIRGALTVNGQAGFDTLNINDQGNFFPPHTYTITSTTVARSPGGPVITYFDIESLNVHPGATFLGPLPPGGGNTVDVESTDASTAVAVDAVGGTTVNVGNDQDGLDELQGPLTIHGDGTAPLTINDQMTGAGQEYDLLQGELVRSGAAPIVFANVQGEVLNGGANGNLFDVDGIAQGTPVQINTGLGTNLTRMRQHALIDDALTLNSQGQDRVGYVAYTTDVYVNFQTGQATDIAALNGTFDLTGGGGNNILVGDGRENITGGSGHNLIISGGGTGQITGGGAGDILIGGTTAYDQDFNSLQAILNYWTTSGQSYRKRVANLRAGNGVPQLEAGITVFDNGAANTITGNGNKSQHVFNLFYVTEAGTVTDQQRKEEVVDIDNPVGAPQSGAPNRPVNPAHNRITLASVASHFDQNLAWSPGTAWSAPADQEMIAALAHRVAQRPDDFWHALPSDLENLAG